MSIFDKLSKEEIRIIESSVGVEMCGFLKKKRQDGLVSMFSSTQDRFFRFFCYGRFLTYYSEEPSMTEPPKNVIFIDEIKGVDNNVEGKRGNFIIKLKNGKDINLKHDDPAVADRWVDCILKVMKVYMGKSMLDFEVDRKWKDEVDIRVTYMIMEELEKENMSKIRQHFKFGKQLEAKGLASYIQQLPEKLRKSRFIFSMSKHTTTRPQEHEKGDQDFGDQMVNRISNVASIGKNMFNAGLGFILPNNLFFDNVFCVLSTCKSYLEDSHTDSDILKPSDIPHWMEMETMYIFKYDDENDKTEYIDKIVCKDILVIEPVKTDANIKSRYCYRIELQDKVHIFCHNFALEVNDWRRALRASKKHQEETIRTEAGQIKKNVDGLVWSFRMKRVGDIQAYIKNEFEKSVEAGNLKTEDVDHQIKIMKQSQDNMFDILDSLQATRPFYQELFKLVMESLHMKWTDHVRKYYNENFKKVGVLSLLHFADLILQQKNKNEKYGMVDSWYQNYFTDILSTYFLRTFKNIVPLAMEVLQKMTKEFEKEKDTICVSYGPVDLFKFLNEILDNSMICLSPSVLKGVLNLISKIIQVFQKEFRIVVLEAAEMEMEIFCALTNSNIKFISACRTLVERTTHIGHLKEEEVMLALNYNNLMKNFAQISNAAFGRIEELVMGTITMAYPEVKDIKKFDLEEFLTNLLMGINPVFKMLQSSYSKKMWKSVAECLVRNYVVMLFLMSPQYKPTETKLFVEKIGKEKQLFSDIFSGNITNKDNDELVQTINYFQRALTDPIEDTIVHIVKISTRLKGSFNDNCIKAIMRLRTDISTAQKEKLISLLEKEKTKLMKMSKRDLALEFYKNVTRELKVRQFIRNLRKKVSQKKEMIRRAKENEEKDRYLNIDKNERLEIEEQAIGMKGMMMVCRKQITPNDVISTLAFKLTEGKKNYDNFYFQIQDEYFKMTENRTSQDVLNRIYFNKVDNIGVISSNRCLYFSFAGELWILMSENEETLRRWTKSLMFMKELCMKKNAPMTFEKYVLQNQNKTQDFLKDEINYDYNPMEYKQKKEIGDFIKGLDLGCLIVAQEDLALEQLDSKLNRSIEMLSDSEDEEGDRSKQGLNQNDGKTSSNSNSSSTSNLKDKKVDNKDDIWDDAKRWMGFL